jgi:hypothetical protein
MKRRRRGSGQRGGHTEEEKEKEFEGREEGT